MIRAVYEDDNRLSAELRRVIRRFGVQVADVSDDLATWAIPLVRPYPCGVALLARDLVVDHLADDLCSLRRTHPNQDIYVRLAMSASRTPIIQIVRIGA
jgi:hypothetical protein